LEAWLLAYTVSRWSIYNVLYWFKPPVLKAVAVIPTDMDTIDPEDRFDADMFKPNGLFFSTPLNHYIRFQLRGNADGDFFVNAGSLIEDFVASRAGGYRVLKGLMKRAQKELSKPDPTEGCTCDVQEEGFSQFG